LPPERKASKKKNSIVQMIHVDQMGRSLELPESDSLRIVSLVPSQTELLFDLGLGDQVVGLTRFCIHPEHARKKTVRVGGTKTVNLDRVHALHPDLIIANKEENEHDQIQALAEHYPIWISDIKKPEDDLDMILSIGKMCKKEAEALSMVSVKRRVYATSKSMFSSLPKRRVLYLIWKDPYMAAAEDTYINSMLHLLGFENALAGMKRYPELNHQMIMDADPDIVFLSSEPYPFKEKHKQELKEMLPKVNSITLVDGEYFSWYGSRMLHLEEYSEILYLKLVKDQK
jgi:ABC-type Fe3+-hydroxamate transport system substrate-binding protein